MIRPILKYGDTPLHEPARNVGENTPDIDRIVEDLIETMYAAPGIGLAAPQIGIALRIFVADARRPGRLIGKEPPEQLMGRVYCQLAGHLAPGPATHAVGQEEDPVFLVDE